MVTTMKSFQPSYLAILALFPLFAATHAACVTSPDPTCGDGRVDDGEACDDANTLYGDGCDGLCAVETNYICTGTPSECIRIN